MRPLTRLGAGVAIALVVPLVGCGDPGKSYCADLEQHTKQIAEMLDSGSPTALFNGLPMLRQIADKAPRDLTDEWTALLGALDGLQRALKDAGVKPSDFKDGKPPAGLSAEDRKAIADAAGVVSSDNVVEASSGIEQQARDVCKVNLGLA